MNCVSTTTTDGRKAGKDAMNCVSTTTTDGRKAGKDAMNCVSTSGGITGNNNPLLHDDISRVIRWYKGVFHLKFAKLTLFFHGNHDFMTTLYDMLNIIIKLQNRS